MGLQLNTWRLFLIANEILATLYLLNFKKKGRKLTKTSAFKQTGTLNWYA